MDLLRPRAALACLWWPCAGGIGLLKGGGGEVEMVASTNTVLVSTQKPYMMAQYLFNLVFRDV